MSAWENFIIKKSLSEMTNLEKTLFLHGTPAAREEYVRLQAVEAAAREYIRARRDMNKDETVSYAKLATLLGGEK